MTDPAAAPPAAERISVPKGRRAALTGVLRAAVAALLLAYLLRQVPFADVRAALGRADPRWIATAFVLALLTQAVIAARLKLLTDAWGLSLPLGELLRINLATRFYGLVLPGGGATAAAIRVHKMVRLRKGYGRAIASIALDRVVASLAMALVGLSFGVAAWRAGQEAWLLLMAGVAIALGAPFVWALGAKRPVGDGGSITTEPTDRLRLGRAAILHIPPGRWARVLGWSVLAHLIGTAEYVSLARSLALDPGVLALGWVRSVMLVASSIPISLSGLGLREGAALLLLPGYGATPESALALSLLAFAVGNLGLGLVGGILEGFGTRPTPRTPPEGAKTDPAGVG